LAQVAEIGAVCFNSPTRPPELFKKRIHVAYLYALLCNINPIVSKGFQAD
jgi:hypothetical protein